MKINHLDLFSGIGGFSLGLKEAGIKTNWIGFSDINKHSNKIFKRRFPNAEELGSITTIQPNKLPNIDLVTFGFPCQDLSIAGKRGGLSANRSSLFFEAIKIIRDKRPKYFIFENVKGVFSSNEGKDFDIILRSIADIGYDGQWELCNTRWYLPQNRERVYFVGHIRGESRPKVFPIRKDDRKNDNDREESKIKIIGHSGSGGQKGSIHSADGVMSCLTATDYKQPKQVALEIFDYRCDEGIRVRKNNCSPTLKAAMTTNSGNIPMIRAVLTPSRAEKRQNGRRFKNDGEDMFTLTAQDNHGVQIGRKIRRLTPTECERLQGFPDGWTDGQSDTQRYKQLGNAVSVPVVREIVKKLYE
jgi:DNA (cytosine-5)-methyltransferase 1